MMTNNYKKMDKLKNFFNKINTVYTVSEEENKQTEKYIESVKALARTNYASVYIIDYLKQGFEFVSDNPLFLCGNTPLEVEEMGYNFYGKHVPDEDLNLLLKINNVGFTFYEKIPVEERLSYTISYDFHLINRDGTRVLVNQKLTPIFLNEEGKIWKAVCLISLSSEKSSGNIKIYKSNENRIYHYDLETDKWKQTEKIVLTKREIEILQLSVQGHTVNEISNLIFVSPDTVKFHKRKLFDKLEVSNISEAIIYAFNNKLI